MGFFCVGVPAWVKKQIKEKWLFNQIFNTAVFSCSWTYVLSTKQPFYTYAKNVLFMQ